MASEIAGDRRQARGAGRFRPELLDPTAQDSDDDTGWLLTYLDVMTLLLVLFIVLLAFADLDPDDTSPSPRVLPDSLMLPLSMVPAEPVPSPQPESPETAATGTDMTAEGVEIIEEADRISLRIQDNLLFDSGRADLTDDGLAVLDGVVEILREHDGPISVEGHTDNVPIATEAFPSNWELSTARATRVLRHLDDAGVDATRMRAVGRADTDPVAPNTNAPGRAANRRVDLIMHQRELP
ncbi:OmpA/MotB family protein [Aquisalimonas asiatica]|uniref:Chemotaxis protein MotB n=1 Tax=Aquisalimonas asiatica TaxID=406100 RepID=A0A1H8UCR4_9GAMM|nr:OmpA family protein [Aquisalimonas asiatica]SEP01052.1 chemotaxis protein MotB [Aquisalimonas asiatica]